MATDPKIFKAYDIRGIYPVQINKEVAYKIGRAFVQFTAAKKVVVGQDARLSSVELAKHLIQGIIDQGASVTDIGLTTTPMMYFACARYNFDGGLMITASHNPKQYNGFKLVKKQAMPIGQDSGLKEVKELVCKNKFEPSSQKGQISQQDVLEDYVQDIFEHVLAQEVGKFKIVADAGNGMAGLVLPKFFAQLNCQVTDLYWQPDGAFPNHLPNPLITETLKDLREKVITEKADLGLAFDGDADRIFFIDEKGQIIKADLMAALMAQIFLAKNPGQKILFDVSLGRIVKETIEKNGGKDLASRIGHSFIKKKMKEENIFFAAEASGHFYLKNDCYRESPFVIVLYLLKFLTQIKKPISEVVKPFEKYFSSGEINFETKDKKAALKNIEQHYQQGQISHLDGLSIEFDDWWFNLRPSNTEPWLRLNLEAKTKELLKQKIKEVSELIK